MEYLRLSDDFNQNTLLKATLQYHLAKKHLARIRRGYYLVTNNYLPGISSLRIVWRMMLLLAIIPLWKFML